MRRPLKQPKHDLFDTLPDDLVVSILSKLSSTASSSSDFLNVLSTCKRLNQLGLHRSVLSKAGPKVFALRPKNWSENAHRFLKHCVNAGNADACYTLGMIRFYCLQNRRSGLSLMAKAAMKLHAPALYSLSVIQFNGSGGSKGDKDLRAGVALSARASLLGHVDALRELGHCLQDGYGVRQNVAEGRRLLVQANLRELAMVLRVVARASPTRSTSLTWRGVRDSSACSTLLSDYGYNVAVEIKNHAVMISQLGRGFKALIPDLYRGKVGLDVAEAQHLFDGLDWQGAVKDIRASVDWLKANGSKKAGVTGYCMGGALAIASSVLVPHVDAVVAFYGVPSSELADPAQAKAPVQAHFGELDNFVGFADVTAAKALEEKLKASGVPHEVHIYPGCSHAFMNRSPEGIKRRKSMGLPDEDEAAVQLAWSRFQSWMTHYLSS